MSRFLFLIFLGGLVAVHPGHAEEVQDGVRKRRTAVRRRAVKDDDTSNLELVGTNVATVGEVTLLDSPQSVFVLTNRTDKPSPSAACAAHARASRLPQIPCPFRLG